MKIFLKTYLITLLVLLTIISLYMIIANSYFILDYRVFIVGIPVSVLNASFDKISNW
jgi:hypothetical protein